MRKIQVVHKPFISLPMSPILRIDLQVTWCSARKDTPWPHIWLIDRCPAGRAAWDQWPFRLLHLLPDRFRTRLLSAVVVPVFQRNPNVLQPLDLLADRLLVANVATITAGLASDRLIISGAPFEGPEGHDVCVLATGSHSPRGWPRDAPDPALYRGVLALDAASWGLAFLRSEVPVVELEARWLTHSWAHGHFHTEKDRAVLRPEEVLPPTDPVRRAVAAVSHMDRLAADLGCTPQLWRLLLSPWPSKRRVGLAVLLGPWLPQHFRLNSVVAAQAVVRVAKEVGGWRFSALCDLYEAFIHAVFGLLCYSALRRLRRS